MSIGMEKQKKIIDALNWHMAALTSSNLVMCSAAQLALCRLLKKLFSHLLSMLALSLSLWSISYRRRDKILEEVFYNQWSFESKNVVQDIILGHYKTWTWTVDWTMD